MHGLVEAIDHVPSQVGNDDAIVQIISSGVGSINENDVKSLAISSNATLSALMSDRMRLQEN